MALQIVWSPLAQQKRKEILTYWIEHNSDNSYSKKLNILFKEATKLISEFPLIGKSSDIAGVRVKIVRDYLLFYEITDSEVNILTIWDSRHDPEGLKVK